MGATLEELKIALAAVSFAEASGLNGSKYPGGLYVSPCLAEARNEWPVGANAKLSRQSFIS